MNGIAKLKIPLRYVTPRLHDQELARRDGYMLAGRTSSMFARSCKRGIT